MEKNGKQKSNSVKLTDGKVLNDAKIIVIKKGYDSVGEYVTQAVKEKNQREK